MELSVHHENLLKKYLEINSFTIPHLLTESLPPAIAPLSPRCLGCYSEQNKVSAHIGFTFLLGEIINKNPQKEQANV